MSNIPGAKVIGVTYDILKGVNATVWEEYRVLIKWKPY